MGFFYVVESKRFELSTSCLQSRRSNQLSYDPTIYGTEKLGSILPNPRVTVNRKVCYL
jgi:hypothetical protein